MTLLDLIPGLKRVSTTKGGEYAGPCPSCGGRDRFRAWPSKGTTGRFWCRSCGKSGDGLQLLRDRDGLTFPEALKAWGLPSTRTTGNRSTRATWEARETITPGTAWADRAGAFLRDCQIDLAGPSGSEGRAFLASRGLEPETIERAGLGWNIADAWENRETWGLPPEQREDGKPRRIWLPSGLVIPSFAGGRVVRLRVRRPNPGDGPRYVIISGSGAEPLTLGTGKVWVIVESELDALLLNQEAGDLAGFIALGNAQARPDIEADRVLKEVGLILVSLDSDRAGAKEAWQWWNHQYKNAKRWPVPIGKDPTEAAQAGLDLRAWVMAGLPIEVETIEPITGPDQNAQTTHQEATGATKKEKTFKVRGMNDAPFLNLSRLTGKNTLTKAPLNAWQL
ncbi:MAG: primase-helicase zinc-binding domain-containing protein [Thermodesulfobacteriota bacterium]